MPNVYLHNPLAPDELIGRVEMDGKVYESRPGPDKYIGSVELETGKIFEHHPGPDRYVGVVALDSGKVYRHKPAAPDDYLGWADADGKYYRHKPLAPDDYVGSISGTTDYALAGAGFLLLIWPVISSEA
jgi:hypothetical protein